MISGDLIPLTFFLPFLIASILFIKTYMEYIKLYREKKNPNYPLLPNEASVYFNMDPIGFIKKLPAMPFLRWKIIFEQHKDQELNESSYRTRKFFWILMIVMIGDFFLHFLALYFNLFSL